MEIRSATPEDVPQVQTLVAKICALHEQWDKDRFKTIQHPEKQYERWLIARSTDPRSVFLVAEHEAKIVAYIVCTIEKEIPIYWMPECGEIHDLWVDEEYRNEGLGKQLTMLTIERFKTLGVKQIRLTTAFANEVGRKLFESCGFRPSTIEMLTNL